MNKFEQNHGLDHNDIALGILRVFTGSALLIKGIGFMVDMHNLYDLTAQTVPFGNFMISHYIVSAHVVGGLFLMVGLLTRISAIVNIPIILGAILFVHFQQGLFSPTQGLELTVMLLIVLCVLAMANIKFLSVDNLLQKKTVKKQKQEKKRKVQRPRIVRI